MAKTTTPTVVRALDLGWGWTKYSYMDEVTEKLEFGAFPSLAPRHAGMDLSLSVLGRRETVVVTVEGTDYEVGPDSADLDVNDATRNLNESYIFSDQYSAVFRGALHYMGEDVIDLLVVGLPLSNMANAPKLKAMMVGEHRINASKTVTVKDALVLPQPLGGLYYCLAQKDRPEFEYLKEEVNLIIDPGFLTFDFLLANGNKIIENRSNAHAGGVSKVLRAVAESLSSKFGIRYDNLSAIDKGLRRRKIKINGEVENLEDHIKGTRSVLEGSVNYMKNIVGDGSDIDNIILVGGGSHLYRKTIETYYPKHTVLTLDDAQTANAQGFQLAGEDYLRTRR
ncbi:PRTRC system protein D [Paraburkholderia sp. UCT31]|uniref:PRTRC system protein D n=1 Tax=Paraburkholderia sp. UCT31 TaxID=2615209 RepID=UPI0016556EC4|nr:PRTRC system protein D [Paraburkholderia sp. UCT31]MBC8737346.1 PRTRC system protein D [Paraburkholderia sp. UCT31]